ncbi:hypothetical protein DE4576_05060 [Mycobacterium marinum]|uniref:PE-PGRS family protein n=1 Tax=Mycobacterium marinum TaxID=1781 RepID=UPI000ECBEF5E|nr:PE-PGRS family protein [Mycobacterium marinum]RFZ62854.1 hypothetical protein DE4576_05060 [Mycobacterium marinum]
MSYVVAVPEILADADAEAANYSILRTARDEALDVINAPTHRRCWGRPLIGNGTDGAPGRRVPVAGLAARPPQR